MITTYTVNIWGETYSIRADWAHASSPVESQGDDGFWIPTGRLVADYHAPEDAMADYLRIIAAFGGNDPTECQAEIDAAVAAMFEG